MSNYTPRDKSRLSPLALMLASEGIAQLPPIYTAEVLQRLNDVMDPIFDAKSSMARSYVTIEDMVHLDLLGTILGGGMRNVLLSMIPDPVLYHCHVYEIAANSKQSHIFSESLAGWHRDADSEHFRNDATHISVFIYMTNVAPQDGAFEFSPVEPTKWVRAKNPTITVIGPSGHSFVWNRNFYHRASPNVGAIRRRLIKISIQPNSFKSAHLSNPNFRAARDVVPPGDPYVDLLLGRYQGMSPPALSHPDTVTPVSIRPTGSINIPDIELTKVQLREKARQARSWLKRRVIGETAQVHAYD